MKRFLVALGILVLCCTMPVWAEGEEQPPVDQPPAEAGESSEPVVVEVNPQINVEPTPIQVTSDGTQVDLYITFAAPEPAVEEEVDLSEAEPEAELAAVPDVHALVDLQEPGGLAQVVVSIFGAYQPRIETVTSIDDAGIETVSESIVPGLAGLDWPWLVGAVLFAIMLHGFLALIGVVLKHG